MKPERFHVLAATLARNGQPESLRTAINRAYYAAFHETLTVLAEMRCQIPTGPSAHGEVPRLLEIGGDAERMQTATKLRTLYRRRREADYDLGDRWPEGDHNARDMVALAEAVKLGARGSLLGPKRGAFVAALRAAGKLRR